MLKEKQTKKTFADKHMEMSLEKLGCHYLLLTCSWKEMLFCAGGFLKAANYLRHCEQSAKTGIMR